jgi:UDP-N-acetylglucosamine transferase subunit ALG13
VGSTRFDALTNAVAQLECLTHLRRLGIRHLVIQHGAAPAPVIEGSDAMTVECFAFRSSLRDVMESAQFVISHAGTFVWAHTPDARIWIDR